MKKVLDFIIEKRYIIALILFILFTGLGISGSSSGAVTSWILEPEKSNNIIGNSRYINSDEYAIEVPFAIAQKKTGMNYFANLNGITKTDMNISVHSPTKSLVLLFRIQNLGYLFLNPNMALAFSWNLKVFALILITYEFMQILTKNKKYLSLIGTILISCSSFANWWMSVNFLIFGELAIISIDRFMLSKTKYLKFLWTVIFTYCAISYILTLYPAWIISFGYIYLGIAIWIIIKNRKEYKFEKIDLIFFVSILLVIGVFGYYFYNSSIDAINKIKNSSYPGGRSENGGKGLKYLFSYLYSFMLPFVQNFDVKEFSSFLSFFPVPIIMALVYLYKKEENIEFILPMLIVIILETVWCISGMPGVLSKITLLSMVPVERCAVSVGLGLIYLYMYMFAHINEKFIKQSNSVYIILIIIAMIMFVPIPTDLDTKKNLYIFVMIETLGGFLMLNMGDKNYEKVFFFFAVVVTLISGLTINPISIGVKPFTETDFAKAVQKEVLKQPDKIWITENMDMVVSNYLVAQGAKTLSATQTYPQEEFWRKVLGDKVDKDREIWNRYAHIQIQLIEEGKTYVELLNNDHIGLYITPNDLKQLNVGFIVSYNDNLEEKANLEKIYVKKLNEETIIDSGKVSGIYIYEFVN